MATGFPRELHDSLKGLKSATAHLIHATCGSKVHSKDVATKLGLHAKLGWQIWHVAFGDEFDILHFLPNSAGTDQFVAAARSRGASDDLATAFLDQLKAFRESVEVHAPSRDLFELILDACSDTRDPDREAKYRRQAFLGNAFTFGVYARTALSAGIVFPGEEEDSFGLARIHGLVDLIQNRVGIRWPLSSVIVQKDDGTDVAPRPESLLRVPEGMETPLLEEFCSKPLPVVTRRMDGMTMVDELQAGVVGLTGARTLFLGEVFPFVGSTVATEPGELFAIGAGVRTPAELLVSDHFVHRDLFPDVEREVCVFNELVSPTAHDDRDLLSVDVSLDFLGTGLGGAYVPEVPEYAAMAKAAFEKIDFDPDQFLHYRVRLTYPPTPTSVMVRHPMNEPRA